MYRFPKTERGLNSKISTYWSALKREKRTYKYIDDGGGSRYIIFCFLFVLNDLEQTKKYFRWYKREFDDDVGEPVQKLCWAISLYRMGKQKEARLKLADLMLSNLYLIPRILGREVEAYDMWHFSNYSTIDYADYIPGEVLGNISESELQWVETLFDSLDFQSVKNRHIEIYHQLQNVNDFETRRSLSTEDRSLIDKYIL